jgi:hypothetical protein
VYYFDHKYILSQKKIKDLELENYTQKWMKDKKGIKNK